MKSCIGPASGWAANMRAAAPASALVCLLASGFGAPAFAFDFALHSLDLTGKVQSQLSSGVTFRAQSRNPELIGKLNIPGQQQFCEDKPLLPRGSAPGINCTDVAGNAAYLALPGAASANNDNGDLNYDKGDIVNSLIRFAPRLQLTHPLFTVDLSAVAFYDPINYNFNEYHPNNLPDNNGFQPRNTRRSKAARKDISGGAKLLDAFIATDVPLPFERELSVKLGNQLLSLGTTTTLVLNGLNTVNPPDANLRFLPGSDLRDVFQRVPLAVLSTSVTDDVALLGFYQFLWRPVTLPPIGSYYSSNDVLGAGNGYAVLLFGKSREDPDNQIGVQERTGGNANLLSNAGRTIYPAETGNARNSGQFGLNLNYLASGFNNTSFDLTYLHLHSRLPVISFIAAQEGCTNRAQNQAQALASCRGFTLLPGGVEPLPIDTIGFFVEYPEDIDSIGGSFSTNLGSVAWTGELVFRPNQPLQIDPIDLGFAALQPVFPADSLNFGAVTIPGDRVAIPDYVETIYRGNAFVQPGQTVRGYERFKTLSYNTSFLLLLGASDNPFGADQVITLLEVGGYQVLDLPSLDRLQLASPGTQFHHSAGIDGTGTPTPQQTQTTNDIRLNPHYQDSGFATAFSWGYRILAQAAYENVLPSLRVAPQLTFFHDVSGRSPLPSGEFFAGREQATLGLNGVFSNSLSATVRYSWFFGGGRRNQLSDRDNIQLSLSYDF